MLKKKLFNCPEVVAAIAKRLQFKITKSVLNTDIAN